MQHTTAAVATHYSSRCNTQQQPLQHTTASYMQHTTAAVATHDGIVHATHDGSRCNTRRHRTCNARRQPLQHTTAAVATHDGIVHATYNLTRTDREHPTAALTARTVADRVRGSTRSTRRTGHSLWESPTVAHRCGGSAIPQRQRWTGTVCPSNRAAVCNTRGCTQLSATREVARSCLQHRTT
jgi:hypothetical protein